MEKKRDAAKKRVIKGYTNVSAEEATRLLKIAANLEFIPVDRKVVKVLERGAKRAKMTVGQYATALLDAQLHAKQRG